jgi:hypothetical protein
MELKHSFVNTELIDKTIAEIKRSRQFNMGMWDACIYGHALRAAGKKVHACFYGEPRVTGAALLGISETQADALFRTGTAAGRRHATKQRTIETLQRLRDTGIVSWSP